jgi:putative transposase
MQRQMGRSFPHKNIRLRPDRYIGCASHFITVCSEGRRPIFANRARAEGLIKILRNESAQYRFAIYAYCVMPDHFHALLSGLNEGSDLLGLLKSVKRKTQWQFPPPSEHPTTPTERRAQTSRATVAATKAVLWQKKFYDHILRPRDSFDAVAGYIWMNPVRAGLCAAPQEYPFSGSFVIDSTKGFMPIEQWGPAWRKKANSAR